MLFYRNQVDIHQLIKDYNITCSIVDHHILRPEDTYLTPYVFEIYDHRPVDRSMKWNETGVTTNIQEVGSCATLIADKILAKHDGILCDSVAALLYGNNNYHKCSSVSCFLFFSDTITFDTIGYNPEAGKVKYLDVRVAEELENRFNFKSDNRKELFEELWTAYTNTSHLNPEQLLSIDLKFISGLPIPVVPMTLKRYLKLPNAHESLTSFARKNKSNVVVLIGLEVDETLSQKKVKRDLAIFSVHSEDMCNCIIGVLKNAEKSKGYDLGLVEDKVSIPNVTYFRQGNTKLTRKHIVPLIQNAVQCCKTRNSSTENKQK